MMNNTKKIEELAETLLKAIGCDSMIFIGIRQREGKDTCITVQLGMESHRDIFGTMEIGRQHFLDQWKKESKLGKE